MKVVTSSEMSRLESEAFEKGAKEETFMEAAGHGVASFVQSFIHDNELARVVTLVCGKGNNGGDAYAAGRLLHREGYAVTAYQLGSITECSELCQQNHYRFIGEGGFVKEINSAADCRFPANGVILDALFGTGFHGAAKGLFASCIESANGSHLPIIAIDIPSGLNGESGEVAGACIHAQVTLFLGLPKTGFFLREGWNNVGRLFGVDFGIDEQILNGAHADFDLLTSDLLRPLMPRYRRTGHKYQAGLVVGLAGSPGMPGAAMLASYAALRSGCGLARLLHPEGMEVELAGAPYELVRLPYRFDEADSILHAMNEARAAFVGPGIGRKNEVRRLIASLLPKITCPVVIDADALTIIAEDKIPYPPVAVITPHLGEMCRLLGEKKPEGLTKEFCDLCQEYVDSKKVTAVLKGAPSFIFHPQEIPLVSSSGDPGMATAGSGDVLTGVIAALIAQGMQTRDAAALGTYLHGVAGERAAEQQSSYCMIASDIIEYLPEAFLWE